MLVCLVIFAVCNVFFFQAEDGIRDGRVTGVQTCALPICVAGDLARLLVGHAQTVQRLGALALQLIGGEHGVARRSEERRVGKECRSRWWAYNCNITNKLLPAVSLRE